MSKLDLAPNTLPSQKQNQCLKMKTERSSIVRICLIVLFMMASIVVVLLGIARTPEKAERVMLSRKVKSKHMSIFQDEVDSTRKVKVLALIGERESGTTWMFNELTKCFNGTLDVRQGLTRDKHWFQYDDGKVHEETVVVAQFRNSYHWILGLMARPHHAPHHQFLDWKTFVTKPWTMPRQGNDLSITNKKGRICKQKFKYDEIVSCSRYLYPKDQYTEETFYSGKRPFYELRNDGSGRPYDSILDLRRDKIRNFILNVSNYDYVKKVLPIQYEELLSQGTGKLIHQIESLTGVSAQCEAVPPQNRLQRTIEPDFQKWMDEHVDWDTEALIGYEQLKKSMHSHDEKN